MLVILFGLLGSGKNYVGEVLRDEFGMTFYDADTDLPLEMREAIRRREIVPDRVRDRFFDIVVARLQELSGDCPRLAGAQALYREKHREQIRRAFPEAGFILVQSTPDQIAVRLAHRADGFVDIEYARKIAPIFEAPCLPHFVLMNTAGRAEVIQQLETILSKINTAHR